MKTATPPKGVTARWVSRRITRWPESRAVISCGTNLSEVFASTLLLSQVFTPEVPLYFGIQVKPPQARRARGVDGAPIFGPRNPAVDLHELAVRDSPGGVILVHHVDVRVG